MPVQHKITEFKVQVSQSKRGDIQSAKETPLSMDKDQNTGQIRRKNKKICGRQSWLQGGWVRWWWLATLPVVPGHSLDWPNLHEGLEGEQDCLPCEKCLQVGRAQCALETVCA